MSADNYVFSAGNSMSPCFQRLSWFIPRTAGMADICSSAKVKPMVG